MRAEAPACFNTPQKQIYALLLTSTCTLETYYTQTRNAGQSPMWDHSALCVRLGTQFRERSG